MLTETAAQHHSRMRCARISKSSSLVMRALHAREPARRPAPFTTSRVLFFLLCRGVLCRGLLFGLFPGAVASPAGMWIVWSVSHLCLLLICWNERLTIAGIGGPVAGRRDPATFAGGPFVHRKATPPASVSRC